MEALSAIGGFYTNVREVDDRVAVRTFEQGGERALIL
jgi:hypothetical protein